MTYKRAHRIPWRVVDGKAVLVSVKNSQVVVFNEVGTAIWTFLDSGRTIEDIVDHLISEFDIDPSIARNDAEVFLKDLKEKEVVDVG